MFSLQTILLWAASLLDLIWRVLDFPKPSEAKVTCILVLSILQQAAVHLGMFGLRSVIVIGYFIEQEIRLSVSAQVNFTWNSRFRRREHIKHVYSIQTNLDTIHEVFLCLIILKKNRSRQNMKKTNPKSLYHKAVGIRTTKKSMNKTKSAYHNVVGKKHAGTTIK